MSTVKYIRIIFILAALFFGTGSEVLAQSSSFSIAQTDIEVKPSGSGTVVVKTTGGIVTNSDGSHTVTITATPTGNYIIKREDIKVQKMLDPATFPARRRTPGIADYLTVEGPETTTTSGEYSFTVPSGYHGAYIVATFRTVIKIPSSTTISYDANGYYMLTANVEASNLSALFTGSGTTPFEGIFEGVAKSDGTYPIISKLSNPLFANINGGIVKNVMLTDVNIPDSYSGNAGALVGEASGNACIYNCGIIPEDQSKITRHYDDEKYEVVIDGFTGNSVGGTGYVGSLIGKLTGDGTSYPRVINCFSYANITSGSVRAGIVGYIGESNTGAITQANVASTGIVVNCMFYGEISGATNKYPVYGGAENAMISNDVDNGINPYCYFRKNASFDDGYTDIKYYKRSWPAEEKNLTRFEYYRSILNSNRRLCTWWVSGTNGTAPTDAEMNSVGIAKWVLDPSIAPYPILKSWGEYPSVFKRDDEKVWYPGEVEKSATPNAQGKYTYTLKTNSWGMVNRDGVNGAAPYEGKKLGTLLVTINPGSHKASHVSTKSDIEFIITDIDTLNHDYGYYKIQLPYYNDEFGNPEGTTWDQKYGGNYKEYVVTGWEVTVSGGTNSFSNYNYADRKCTAKDDYNTSGRIFAQGGYYYVPDGVTSITITAHWGKAVYLANRNYSIDNVKVTAGAFADKTGDKGKIFTPAGTIEGTMPGLVKTGDSYTFQGRPVYDDLQKAISGLENKSSNADVYNQAIVLIGNHQVKNGNASVAGSAGNFRPFTIMSADFNFDNEPDYCLQFQFRDGTGRPGIQPIRFDFLPVVELGLALRHDSWAYAIGIFIPQGHFEITETALMRTTQFEWDSQNIARIEKNSPVILNGGEFDQITVRYANGNRTSYFLLGGNLWFHRFALGPHPNTNTNNNPSIRLCPINVIGGDFPEFYLSGLYRPDKAPYTEQGNPYCYTNGGHFGIMAGAGYEKINGNVTFKIDHSVISEFYGGGINGSKAIGGNIDVTIDHSKVDFYCGGPKVGVMSGTATTNATGTTFGVYYGGGNGGNSYYRELQYDGDANVPNNSIISDWTGNYNWGNFTPLATNYDDGSEANVTNGKKIDNKGYHAEYEFEVFNHSNGVSSQITKRGFIKWIQFGLTETGKVTNTLKDCIINTDFYGGGNRGVVNGDVISTLTNTTVYGNAFGAGYSASIPTFRVHSKSNIGTDDYPYPKIDKSGTLNEGKVGYGNIIYKWTNDDNEGSATKTSPIYSKVIDGVTQYFCYTWNSLTNLGTVTGDVSLTITSDDNSKTSVIGTLENGVLKEDTGNVFGGGDESSVTGDATVTLSGNVQVLGNVFGGGNQARVGGSAKVEIKE